MRSNSVTRQDTFNRTKIGRKCQNLRFKWDNFWEIFKHHFFLQLLVLQYYFNALFFKAYQTWEDGFWFVYIIKLQLWVLLTKYIKMPSWHTPGRLIFLLSKVMSKVGKNIFAIFSKKGAYIYYMAVILTHNVWKSPK